MASIHPTKQTKKPTIFRFEYNCSLLLTRMFGFLCTSEEKKTHIFTTKDWHTKKCNFFSLFFFLLRWLKLFEMCSFFCSACVTFIFLWMFFAHTNSRFNALLRSVRLLLLFYSVFCFFCILFRLHWVTWVKTITMYIVIGFCQWQKSRPQTQALKAIRKKGEIEQIKCVKKNKTASRITKPKIRLSIIECKRKSRALQPMGLAVCRFSLISTFFFVSISMWNVS